MPRVRSPFAQWIHPFLPRYRDTAGCGARGAGDALTHSASATGIRSLDSPRKGHPMSIATAQFTERAAGPGLAPDVTRGARQVRAPRSAERTCKSWQAEAAMRMLMNNLDPEVAERPEALVVYGGRGQ